MRHIEITDPALTCLSCMRLLGLSRGAHSDTADLMTMVLITESDGVKVSEYVHGSLYLSTCEHAGKALQKFKGGDTVT